MGSTGRYELFREHDAVGGVPKGMITTMNQQYGDKYGEAISNGHAYHSDKMLMPNVVRIEVLSPQARRRYLNGGLPSNTTSFAAEQDICKQYMIDKNTGGDAWKPFYGITDQSTTDSLVLNFSSQWQQSSGTFGSKITELTGKTAKAAGDVLSMAGAGLLGAAKGLNKVTGTILKSAGVIAMAGGAAGNAAAKYGPKIISSAPEIGNTLASSIGMNMKTSGATTLKQYVGSQFTPSANIACKWYMPEQSELAKLSIQRLVRMSYARGYAGELDAENIRDFCQFAATAGFKSLGNTVKSNASNIQFTNGSSTASEIGANVIGAITGGSADLAAIIGSAAGNQAGELAMAMLSAAGYSLSVDPLPVRLTVGHVIDVEPLVITGVKLTCSKEQFIDKSGAHIPLFVTATITFEMWMMPNPNVNFIKFLGHDIFNDAGRGDSYMAKNELMGDNVINEVLGDRLEADKATGEGNNNGTTT